MRKSNTKANIIYTHTKIMSKPTNIKQTHTKTKQHTNTCKPIRKTYTHIGAHTYKEAQTHTTTHKDIRQHIKNKHK